ncbi:MarR family protease production transcriptional regulator HPr [Evansella vedderi]|uniref:MarR family protease production transcriptional regulator HPr n=1 Tax=Evansella vedderi TaxID=38282 RepID=A0ABT9ZY91_9BACI|nr:MarR family transcriptional regulator [Evansella vedderi]MDQ0256215.1 MarR family protease production transcriptional regulator HPr [Evansella vedderi]
MTVKSNYHLLINYIRGMSKVLEEEWQSNAKDIGLTLAEQHVMWIVNSKEKISVTDIAKIGLWDRSTVMQIIKRLQEKDLIYMTKNKKDLRVTFIALTKEGKAKRDESQQKTYKFFEFIEDYQKNNKEFMEEFLRFYREFNRHFHGEEFVEWVEETTKNYKDL